VVSIRLVIEKRTGFGIDILKAFLLNTFDCYGLDIKVARFQQNKATPHTSVITIQRFSKHGFSVNATID
jgi:hypothetical protein